MIDLHGAARTVGAVAARSSPTERASAGVGRDSGGQCTFWTDARGVILDCCEHAAAAFGHGREDLLGMPVGALLPGLADVDLLHDGAAINSRLAFKCRCSLFRAVLRDGMDVECTLSLTVLGSRACPMVKIIVSASDAQSRLP